jgi:hypothetical protein
MEFGVAKELVVECGLSCNAIRFGFHVFFLFYARYENFDSYFKVSRSFCVRSCCEK